MSRHPKPPPLGGGLFTPTAVHRLEGIRIICIIIINLLKPGTTKEPQLIDMMKGSMGVPHLFQSDIRRFPVTIPPLNEQNEIVSSIENEAEKIDMLHAAYSRQITLLTEYRAALIHECVTGQRVIPDHFNTGG